MHLLEITSSFTCGGKRLSGLLAMAGALVLFAGSSQAQPQAEEVWWPSVASSITPAGCAEYVAKWLGVSQVPRLAVDQPQAVATGLVQTGLLEALNRAELKHTLFQDPVARKVSFVAGRDKTHQLAFAFVGNHLEAWLWRVRVTPDTTIGGDQNAFVPSRLASIHALVNEVGRRCRVRTAGEDEEGRIRLTGNCGGQKVYVEYFPESDEVWLVFLN